MDFYQAVQPYKEALLNDLTKLLKIDTTLIEQPSNPEAPFGLGLRSGLDFVLELGKKMGFKTKKIDEIVGYIEFGEGSELVGVLAHIDVVPAGEGWTYPPFSATIVGDRLYSRGAMDDKGPLMAALYAMKILKDSGLPLKKRIRLIVGTDEETQWRDINCYLEKCEIPSVGFSPDAGFPLIYGEKGILSFDILTDYQNEIISLVTAGARYNVVPEKATAILNGDYCSLFESFNNMHRYQGRAEYRNKQTILTMYGKSAHAMNPEVGVNALGRLSEFLALHTKNPLINFISNNFNDTRLKNIGLNFTDPEMKDLTMNLALALFSAHKGKVGINMRYPIHWDKENFFKQLQKKAPNLKIDIIEDKPPHYVPVTAPLIKTLHKAYIKYTKDEASPLLTIGGGTYARAFKNMVAFGMMMPNQPEVAHEVDEYLIISHLITATAIYAEALYELGK